MGLYETKGGALMQPVPPRNTPRRRTQHHAMPPVTPPAPAKKRRRFSLVRTLLMLIGLGTVFVLLARYVIVPVLVMLPQWMGGAV